MVMSGYIKKTQMTANGNRFIILHDYVKLSEERIKSFCKTWYSPWYKKKRVADGVVILEKINYDFGVFMHIYNADGSMADICGNALRCVATLLDKDRGIITTRAGAIETRKINGIQHVCIGLPRGNEKPLQGNVHCYNFGNAHRVIICAGNITERAAKALYARLLHENKLESNCTAVFVSVYGKYTIATYEKGVGITKACGTAACAALMVLEDKLGCNDVTFENGVRAYFGKDGKIWITGEDVK